MGSILEANVKRIICFGILVGLLAVSGVHSQTKEPCSAKAKTQGELDDCAAEEFKQADAELNRVYKQLLAKSSEDRPFAQKLRRAQRAWIVYRDAHIDSRYPERCRYGSVHTMCYFHALRQITEQRIKSLREIFEDRDICASYIGEVEPCGTQPKGKTPEVVPKTTGKTK